MNTTRQFALTACALATAVLLTACGGGDASGPPDTIPPTVVITDNVSAASTNGPVTFTFTFSESVGSSFTADDVVVSGGTKGAFTVAADSKSATLVVTPTANASGTMKVDLAAAVFSDLAGNKSTTAYTGSQDYSTLVVVPVSGSTGTCTATTCTNFSAAGIGFGLFENNGGTVEIANDPNDATNKVVKFVKKSADNDYFGTTITGLAGPAVLTAADKTVTLRVYSPAAGTNMLLKFEGGTGAAATTEMDAVTTKVGEWETLSFVMPDAGTFSTTVLFPHGRSKVAADTPIYVDELKFPAAAVTGNACSSPSCIDFSGAAIGFGLFENNGGTVAIAADPLDGTNKVAKFVKKPADNDYFGTTITGLGASVVLTPTAKTVTMRVYSPAVGTNFLLKFEGGTGGAATTEKDAVTTKANAWETLTFVMPDAGTFSTIVVFPNGRSKVSVDTTMYIDDLKFPATASSSGGGGVTSGFTNGIFSDDYVGTLPDTAKSTQGGNVGFFLDARLSLAANKVYDYGGVSGTAQDPGGVHNFYYGVGLNAPAITDAYFGAFVKAPGNGNVDVAAFTSIKVNVWGPDQLFKAGAFPSLNVVLQGPAVAGCSSASGGSEVETTFNTTGQGADKVYTLALNGFTLKASCSGETTVAQVLTKIAQVNIVLKNANIQYTNKDPNGVAFTNGLNVGKISFN